MKWETDAIWSRLAHQYPVTETERELLSQYFQPQKASRGEILKSPGDSRMKLYFVVSGALRFYQIPVGGGLEEITRTFGLENQFCTNILAFTESETNQEFIQALEDSYLLVIDRQQLFQLLRQSQVLTEIYARLLEYFLCLNLNRFTFLNTLTEKERVEQFLATDTQYQHRFTNRIIASYLRVSTSYYTRRRSQVGNLNLP